MSTRDTTSGRQIRRWGGSPGWSHPSEQPMVPGQDPARLGWIRCCRPLATLVGTAQEDPVAAGKHVEQPGVHRANRQVVDLRLGHQYFELPLDRDEVAVGEKRGGPEASAVHDGPL